MPATYLRGGTSKGIFLDRRHLPQDRASWKPIFLGLMGSPDSEYGRQLNGMGGGVSSLSKICVVEPPTDVQKAEGIDVVYTFAQVGIRDADIDYSGNCGNLSSMIGVYAVDEGLCRPRKDAMDPELGTAPIRSLNTNTNKVIDTTFPVARIEDSVTPLLDLPQVSIAGVSGKASRIIMDFVSPGGARTGRLLPTGNPVDEITLSQCHPAQSRFPGSATPVPVSLVDATNPTVFVDAHQLSIVLGCTGPLQYDDMDVRSAVESIRQQGARMMGLDPSAQAQPKIAMLSPPAGESDSDIVVHAFSMGVLHKAVPMTVGACLGVASILKGTIAWDIVRRARSGKGRPDESDVTLVQHPGGTTEVRARFDAEGHNE
ncbi:hypothetical protein EIP86_005909 [Pleurotus ostreatoroseus]|nr:hypothetical protein EIP86_005909 [Pleurotus ostreatoroseus]